MQVQYLLIKRYFQVVKMLYTGNVSKSSRYENHSIFVI